MGAAEGGRELRFASRAVLAAPSRVSPAKPKRRHRMLFAPLRLGWERSLFPPQLEIKDILVGNTQKKHISPLQTSPFFFFFPNPQVQKGERKCADRAAEPCADPSLSTENQLPIPLSFCLSPSSPAGPSSALPRQLLHIQVPMSPAKALTDLHSSAGEPDWFEGTEAAFPGPEWLCGKKKKKKQQPNPTL